MSWKKKLDYQMFDYQPENHKTQVLCAPW